MMLVKFLDFDDQVEDVLDMIHPEAFQAIYGVHSSKISRVDPSTSYYGRSLAGPLLIP
jgi:hypothetical protein